MSKIEWTGKTWNFIRGCTLKSKGCENCYAMRMAWRLQNNPVTAKQYEGTTRKTQMGKIQWTGQINIDYERLNLPIRVKKPTVYFVNSMSDLFHEQLDFNLIYKAFEIMHLAHWHTFQVLTKRAERLSMLNDVYFHLKRNYPDAEFPSKNVWIGVSVEDQKAADERIHYLNYIPAAVKFLSCEPLLGPVDLHKSLDQSIKYHAGGLKNCLSWVIVGGESGPGARPMHPDWARSLRDQCINSGVPFFFKQWGNFMPSFDCGAKSDEEASHHKTYGEKWVKKSIPFEDGTCVVPVGKKAAGRLLDGKLYDEYPKPTL